ncbi:HNH endonuclease [Actibacterium sp. 188UL27-1]|nr:HNH endonuclease [Actibacterium sp. 188UL27-1]
MPTDYHHIKMYSKGGQHDLNNLVLLCKKHHDDATHRRLSENQIKAKMGSPYRDRSRSPGYYFDHIYKKVIVAGGNTIDIAEGSITHILAINDYRFSVRIEGDIPFFSFNFPDMAGNQSFRMEDNSFFVMGRSLWDFRLKGSRLEAWHGTRKKFIQLSFVDGELIVNDLKVFCDGIAVRMTKKLTRCMWIDDVQQTFYANYFVAPMSESCLLANDRVDLRSCIHMPIESGTVTIRQADKWFKKSARAFHIIDH